MKINAEKYLKNLTEKSAWVFTKQETDFDTSVLATKLFSDIPNIDETNVEQYFSEHHNEYEIDTDRHRMMVIPQLFGLITKTPFYQRGVQYSKERPTAVFDEFRKLIEEKDDFQTITNQTKYNELKTEQILKLKIHAIIDTANNNEDYFVLPVLFIYKVLKDLQIKYGIEEVSIDHLYTYIMTCKNYKDLDNAVEFIKDDAPISEYVSNYKGNSRILTCIRKNINLFDITSTTISINNNFDDYFYNQFFLKYDFDELNEILLRDVDYSYFLYNVQGFDINLIDVPSVVVEVENKKVETTKEVIKVETSVVENDDDYEVKVDEINEGNVNRDVAIGAHKISPISFDHTKISKKYKRNPLLGKIAIQNAYYCCEKDARHETFESERTRKSFMEAHHLVPVMYQQEIWDKYEVNVDCVENIISLCPTCHRAFHNGTKEVRAKMIENLYEKLLPRYKSIGFNITLDEIKKLYNI